MHEKSSKTDTTKKLTQQKENYFNLTTLNGVLKQFNFDDITLKLVISRQKKF